MISQTPSKNLAFLRLLPSVDSLLRTSAAAQIEIETGAKYLTLMARNVIEDLRNQLTNENFSRKHDEPTKEKLLAEAINQLQKSFLSAQNSRIRKVINATGVVIHTNLGRAPLSEKARRAIYEKSSGYCNLEYDLETGKRGKRGAHAEQLLAELTGAESAIIVNNCAAAAFLVLTVLAKDGEAIVSRGELVEIGGDFRVPDVMEQSGAMMREVGTTNRTRIADYERAINENTRLLLKVHPSNYRIIGFTAVPKLSELAGLAHRNDVLLYEDAGSGALTDLSAYGLTDEPVISQSIGAGADVVTFSGDKLLGGVQSGLIVGRREIVERIRQHPLYRALRVDKLIYAALEATLESFRRENSMQEIPVLKMLSQTNDEIMKRTAAFAGKLSEHSGADSALKFSVTEGKSVIGGGSAPDVQPATTLLTLSHEKFSVSKLEEKLRNNKPPVITRILENKVLIDLRTVAENEESELLRILMSLK